MPVTKRAFDLAVALVVGLITLPVLALIALAIRLFDGAPVLYASERIGEGRRAFTLWKFRTMQMGSEDGGVSGAAKAARVSALGGQLRRFRLDELPQLWNILAGEMSLVGPRPPLRRYVERFPELYADVLVARPGITGLATLAYHRHEGRLLAGCTTAEETDAVYSRRCVPRKARLDLIYLRRRSLPLDLRILVATVRRVLSRG